MSEHQDHDCAADCEVGTDRRSFLRDGLAALAAITAVAGSAAPLHALARSYAVGVSNGQDALVYPIPTADGATIDDENKVIIVRYQGTVHAFSSVCPHKGSLVEWQGDNNRFFCPKHKSTFKPDGGLIDGKATRNLDRYGVTITGGKVQVNKTVMVKSDEDEAGWAKLGVKAGR